MLLSKVKSISNRIVARSFKRPNLKKYKLEYDYGEEVLGCSYSELKTHLESLFKDGMSFFNYGTVWEIDHKIPIS